MPSPPADRRPDLRATEEERRLSGMAARRRVRRSTLGDWSPEARGHDPVQTLLAQNTIRDPNLLPIRFQRMSESRWNFFRGAAAVMAADLASQPHTDLFVQLCGDAHVLNFGLWATPERNLGFDVRDFDETLPGPFEWDVKRLAASLVVAGRENDIGKQKTDSALDAALEAYRDRMHRYAAMSELDIWYDGTHVDSLLDFFEPADRGRVAVYIEKRQRNRTSRGAYEKLTTTAGGRPRITEDPPIRVAIPDDEQAELAEALLAGYRQTLQDDRRALFERFTMVDVVRQVVGVGSVGMRVYLLLFEGRRGVDPLFLQVKQAGASVYEAYLGRSAYDHHGARVINGKRLIQTATDIFVGWGSHRGRDYYVRQFRDMKIIPTTTFVADRLAEFAAACGEALARAHARTGDPVSIDAYIGRGPRFAAEIARFANAYADQNDRDHAELVGAISAGEVGSLPH